MTSKPRNFPQVPVSVAIGLTMIALAWCVPRMMNWSPSLWNMTWEQGFFSMFSFGMFLGHAMAIAMLTAGAVGGYLQRSVVPFWAGCLCASVLLVLSHGGVARTIAKVAGVATDSPAMNFGQCRVSLRMLQTQIQFAAPDASTAPDSSCAANFTDLI